MREIVTHQCLSKRFLDTWAELGDLGRNQESRLCSGSDAGRKQRQVHDMRAIRMALTLVGKKAASALSQEGDIWSVLWFGQRRCCVVLRHDSRGVLFLSWSIMVTE